MHVASRLRIWGAIVGIGSVLLLGLATRTARAATLTWDPNGNQSDGSGTWATTTANWWNLSTDVVWTNGNTAVFGVGASASNPYTVTVNGGVTAAAINFNNQLYTLTGGTITLNGATTFGSPDISVPSGVAAEIDSAITKTTAAFINGGGTLTLGGSDSFAPQLWVDNSTLQVVNGANINVATNYLVLGNNAPNSNYVQTGGSITMPDFYIGNAVGNTSAASISGGTFTASGTVHLAERANGVMNISGGAVRFGLFNTGENAANTGILNLSAGSLSIGAAGNSILAKSNSARGVFNISGGTVNQTANFLMVGNTGITSAAVVNQTGGLYNMGASGALLGWAGGNNTYAAYLLSAGTFNMTGSQFTIGNQGSPEALYSQSGGSATFTNAFNMGFNTIGGQSVADISGGTLVHTAGNFMSVGVFGTSSSGTGILTVRGGGYLQEQSGNFNVTGINAGVTGIVNLLSGGTIEANSIKKVSGASARATINFDGGTLRAYATNAGANFLTGVDNAFVYPGGLTVDSNSQNVTVGPALTVPLGYGVATSGSTVAVAGGGGGYIAPPVIKFAAPAGGGVAATGVATINANGTVTGITVTSPGSGYASGESVAVTFNNGNNISSAATSAATGFNVIANTLNASGGLTKVGAGALTLAGNNTYAGPTNVSGGTLYLNGSNATPSISVAGGAALGGIGSTATAGANVANNGILDFSQNAGHSFSLAGGLNFAGHSTINIDGLSNYPIGTPALTAGALNPSSTAGLISINANLGSVSVLSGTYDLINYSGSIGGAGASAFTLASVNGLGNRQSASLVNASNQLDVVVNGFTPYWNGNQPDWVTANAWTLQPGNSLTTFQTRDSDIFDDTALGSTYGGTVLLSGGNVAPASVTFNNTSLAYTVSGNFGITGSASLSINGGGLVTITNSNGYTGATTIGSFATLQIGGGGASGSLSPASAITNNGTLNFSRSDNIVQGVDFGAAGISGSGQLVQLGPGMLTLTASNTYSGLTTISSGTLQLGTGLPGQDGSINNTNGLTNNGTLAYNLAGSQTASYAISGGGDLVKAGSGTLLLGGTNSYGNGTTLTGGTLVSANAVALGGNTAPVTINNGNNNVELRFTAAVQNSNQATTYMPITVTGGGTGSAVLTFNQGTAFTNASLNIGQAVTIRTTTGGTSYGMMGQITGNGAGAGNDSVIFSAPSGVLMYYTAGDSGFGVITNDFSGNVRFTGSGTIATQNLGYISPSYVNGAIPDTASVTVDPGTTWQLNWGEETIDALNGSGSVNITTTGPSSLTLGGNNGSGTFSGMILGAAAGGVTLSGTGLQVLSGSNTYTDITTINSGTLQIGNGGGTGALSPASVITNNGVLSFSRSDNITQGTHFSGSPITGSGTLAQLGPGTLTLNAANSYSGPTLISGGVLNVASLANVFTPSPLGTGTGSPADLVIDGGTLQYTGAAPASTDRLFTVGASGHATLDASGGPAGTMTLGVNGGAIAFANSSAPATLTLTGSGPGVLGAAVGNSGSIPNITSIVKTGAGTWNLAGANTYTGTTAVNAGTLYISGTNSATGPTIVSAGALYITGSAATTSISVAGAATLGGTGSATSAAANVANGGILDFSANAGNTFSLGGVAFAGHATINLDALTNYTANPVLSTGALTPSSTAGLITIDANLGSATVLSGTYDLIRYTGSIGGAGLPAFTIAVNGIGNRQTATLVNVSNQIDLVVNGFSPFWSGNQADWRATNAWTLHPGNTPTTFQTGDGDTFDDSAIGSTFGGNVALNAGNVAPATVTFNNNSLAYTVSGSFGITGSATLTVNGPGTVTIANSNGYTGATTLAGGQLNLANPAAIGSGLLALNGGVLDNTSGSAMTLSGNNPQHWNGSFTFQGSNPLNLGAGAVTLSGSPAVTVNASTLTLGGPISGGALTLNGFGTLLLTASNTYTGATTINSGTLQLGSGAAGKDGSINSTALVNDNATLAYNLAASQTASYAIGGFGGVALNSGNLTLLGSNTYSAGTSINGGTLQIGNSLVNGTFGTGQYNIAAGARLYLNYATAVPASNGWSSNISGSGTLELNSAQPINGTANWGPNSAAATVFGAGFTGTLQLDNGRIDASPAAMGGVSNIIINNGGQFLAWSGTYSMPITIAGYGWGEGGQIGALRAAGNAVTTWTGPITLSSNAGIEAQAGSNFTLTGPITGNFQADFESNGGGTATVAPTGTSQNSYLSTGVNPGVTVVAGNQYAFSTGALLMNFGTMKLNGFNFSFAHVLGSGAIGNYGGNPATITVGGDNSSNAYGGTLIDGGAAGLGLAKIGSGSLILTGANTYSGGTTISGGTLQLGNGGAGGDGGSGPILNNARLVFDRSDNFTLPGAISGSGSVTQSGSGAVVLSGGDTYNGGTTINAGKLYVNGSLAGAVAVNGGGLLGGSGTASAVSVAAGGGIEGGYSGTGTLTLTSVAYAGSGSFTTNGYTSYSATAGVAPLHVTASNGLNTGSGSVAVNLGGPVAIDSGTYHLIQYSGAIGGSGSAAFALGTVSNISGRTALTYGLVNNPSYLDVSVSLTPVIWTGSLSTAWSATDTDPAPKNWSFAGSPTNFLTGDIVHFDNSTAAGGTVDISNGSVLPTAVEFNNNAAHPYTLAGANGIGGTAWLVKNGPGIVTITANNNSFTGDITVNGGTLAGAATSSGGNSVFGAASSTRTITVNAGATLLFEAPNLLGPGFNSTNIPALVISGGTVTNLDPLAGSAGSGQINSALNNVTLINGLLTATTGEQEPAGPGYAAWNINGTITSSGTSRISTSEPVFGTVMLMGVAPFNTPINVQDGTLAISAPLVQDDADSIVSGLTKTGSGTLILSGSNTYMGGTTVSNGTLIVTTSEAIADGTSLNVGDPTLLSQLPAPVIPSAVVASAPEVAPVPEPGTLGLLAAGAIAMVLAIRRKKSIHATLM